MTPTNATTPTVEDLIAAAANAPLAGLNVSHRLYDFMERLITAPPAARVARAVGELATALDGELGQDPYAVLSTTMDRTLHHGRTALSLSILWARWGHRVCLIDLGTGQKSLEGLIDATEPDLRICDAATWDDDMLSGLTRLTPELPNLSVIASGYAEVLSTLSKGQLELFLAALRRTYNRIVIASPPPHQGFPVLSAAAYCERIVVTLTRGKSRSRDVEQLADEAARAGVGPLVAIWYE